MAGIGKVVMGLAGLMMGVQGLTSSAKQLNEGLAGARPVPRRPTPPRQGIAGLGAYHGGLGLATEPAAAPQVDLPYPVGRDIRSDRRSAIGKHIAEGNTQQLNKDIQTLSDRVRWIRDRVTRSLKDPYIYTEVAKVTSATTALGGWAIPEKDNIGEARAIFRHVRGLIRYTSDTYNVDTFATARVAMTTRRGDCDDFATVLCTLCMSVGIPCQLVVVATRNSARMVNGVLLPNPDHIYCRAGFPRSSPTKWIAMDGSVPVEFGWEVPDAAIVKKWIYKATL